MIYLIYGITDCPACLRACADLMEKDNRVHLITDAVMSRHKSNYDIALRKMEQMGVHLTSVEMALFELQRVAKGETFKPISTLIK